MKIINVIQDFNTGGRQKLLIEYLRFFKNYKSINYQVVVLEKPKGNSFEEICRKECLNIVFLNNSPSTNKHYYIRHLLDWWNYNHSLYRFIKKQNPDIIHTHNTRIFIRIKSCLKKLSKKFKIFHSLCSDPFAVNNNHVPIAKKMFLKYGIKPICINRTQFLKAQERYGINSCDYIFNGFDQNNFKNNLESRTTTRKELGIPENAFVVGCIGRIMPVKNYSFFIEIMSEVVKMNPSVFALIAGDTSNSLELSKLIEKLSLQNNIKLIGVRKDINNIYNCIDRFVSTSLTEAFSFSCVEAQVFNLFCIVSEAIPLESICLSNKVVRLSLKENPTVWAQQILKPSQFCEKYSSLEDFSIQNTAQKLMQLYTK